MKKKLIALFIALFICAAFIVPFSLAAGDIYFTAVNDTIMPLSDSTMPVYFGSTVYLPHSAFTSNNLGMYYTSSGGTACMYTSKQLLFFYLNDGKFYDSVGKSFPASAVSYNGTYYLPVEFITSYFGLSYSIIDNDPAPIIRIYNKQAIYNNNNLVGIYKSKMKDMYNQYTGYVEPVSPEPTTSTSPPVTSTPPPVVSPSPTTTIPDETDEDDEDDDTATYDDVTLYLSFTNIGSSSPDILDSLDNTDYSACFFVTESDIINNADTIREIIGSGYSIGLMLSAGTQDEYNRVSGLLFEAAKVKTILVTSDDGIADVVKTNAAEVGLIYWNVSRDYTLDIYTSEEITGGISTAAGSREHIMLSCNSRASVISDVLSYIGEKEYRVDRIIETRTPTPS